LPMQGGPAIGVAPTPAATGLAPRQGRRHL
jgi:hypothetical protein